MNKKEKIRKEKENQRTTKNMNLINNSKGITLIALVITIIVLLILAGVTINLTMGENGIFRTAQEAGEAYKISEITEKLELAKLPVQLDNMGMTVLDKYLEELIEQGIITQEDIEETGNENSRYITVEGEYVYLIEEIDKDIKIEYQGKTESLLPGIQIEVADIQSTSISIRVNARRMENGEYSYYIKNITKGEEYIFKETLKTNEYIFSNLDPENQYQIKVEATNANGTTSKESAIITTVQQKVTQIILNAETLTLENGETDTLTATVLPENASNKNVIWSTTNEDIVSVNNGTIQAVSLGTAKITAEAADGSGIKATCTVTVQQLVTEITLSKTNITLESGQIETLTATVLPENASNKNINWSSSNTSVATVNNGTIQAVNFGTAIITAEAADGSGVKATCTVTVQQLLSTIAEPGDYIKYDTGTYGIITFRVLYNDDTYGLQIISAGNVEQVTLGSNGINDSTAWRTAMNSYNSAIAALNLKAEKYATNSPYALDGRCVGSVPTVGADGTFTAKSSEVLQTYSIPASWTMPSGWTSRDTKCQKGTDTNYETDYDKMETLEESGVSNILTTGKNYWLASRYVRPDFSVEGGCGFSVRCVSSSGRLGWSSLCYVVYDGGTDNVPGEAGLRPCISLRSDVKVVGGGDGSSESQAYELGI